jgi:UDP-glucose 4-epimerase
VNVLVTGGAGFIGHHLVRALVGAGHDVVVFDDFSSGQRDRVSQSGASRIVEGDLRMGAGLIQALEGREVVFHEAALVSVARSVIDPVATNAINVDGTIRLMIAAAEAGVRRVVVASSSAVYGASAELPSRESQRPDPQSPYATSKLAAEHYVHNLGSASGIETVALRYFNVFGPGQDPQAEYAAVVPRFIMAALSSTQPIIYGDGMQSRDFTFVDDVVAANLMAAEAPRVNGLTVNVGSGERRSLLELLSAVGQAVDCTLDPLFEAPRAGDIRDSQADVSLAAERLGYRAAIDLSEGIRRSVAWYAGLIANAAGAS